MAIRDLYQFGGNFTMTPHRSASTNITGYSYVSQDRLLATTIKVVGTFDGESISSYGFRWSLDNNTWHKVVLYNGSWTNVQNVTAEKNIRIEAIQGSVYLSSYITRKDYDTTYSPSILYRYNNVMRLSVTGLISNDFTSSARASEINVEDGFQYVLYDPATDEVTGFSEDTKILSVDLSDTDTTELGRNAFKGCSNLETVAFPSTLQEIGDSAFFECSSLAGVDVYNTETIGDYAFSGCSSLETLILGENTSEIGDYAFEYCPSLTDVTSYAVEPPSLGTNNFTASGDTLYVPNEAVSVYEEDSAWSDAFSTIRPLQNYIRIDVVAGDHGTASGSGWYETGDTVVISATADTGYHFLQWNDGNTDNPRTITVGATDVTYTASFLVDAGTVGNTSYSDVTKTSFSASAFFNGLDTTGYGFCYSTTNSSPDLNDTVVTIGNGSINANATASIINLTPSTTYYVRGFITNAAGTVYNTAITISTDAYTISYTASSEITGTWVDNNTNTSRNTYDSGSGVLYLNAGVTTIGGSASADYSPFYRNSNILTVDLRESNISTIGSHAFQESSVRLVSLPSTLTTIGNSAFYYCGLNEINIPNSVTTIGSGAFRDCLALESVELPSGITSIAEHTFNNTGIVSIEIPAGVTSIGNSAFDYCADLDEVTCFATMPPTLGANNFTASNDTLYVPYSSIASYNATSPWNIDFEQIRPIGDYSYLSVTAGSHGSVTGGGWYLNGTTAQISATADTHYHFDEWSDGDTNAIRNILVSQDASYTASFEVNSYVITVVAGDHGSATGGGTYDYGTSIQISATPDTDYNFTGWNDGNTDNPRTITVTGDATYTASFAINSYTLTITGDAHTSVTGSGTYPSGTSVQIEATPDSHYHFVQWSDGNTDNPRTITVTSNITLSASSAIDTHTITVTSDAHGTASGSGTYDYGDTATISITPDSNYHFVQWNDGNTSNPRSVTVTGDATYSGTTAIDQFTLTVTGDLNTTVTGSGTYDYGTSVQITATPNTHYHFVAWSDGDTNATRTIVVTSDITLTATSAIDTYTVTVTGDANTDTTSGSGTYGYGSSVTISATPVAHYHFARWQDNNTDNPRTITVTSDVTYTATTAIDQHVITTQGDSHIASVTGGGLYDYGTQVTLTATPDTGYHFVQWTDGNTDNPRTITVTGDETYRATSALNIYTITVNGDAHTASTTGSGQWGYGSQFQISATPDSNYHFVAWNDGNTDNPRYITVTGDATYTASMSIDSYLVNVSGDAHTTVTGGGTYSYGDSCTITATPDAHYHFVQWSDGDTNATRTFTVTSNVTLTASSAIDTYTVTLSGDAHTTVSGGGTYDYGDTATLTATPDNHYHFVKWSDDDTTNPRTITVTSNVTLSASSAIDTHTITVLGTNTSATSGSGTYDYGDSVQISVTPNTNYHFTAWNDSDTNNPRTITVTGDATYTGACAIDQFTLTVSGDANTASTTGSGTYDYGTSVQISATPNSNYHFSQWNDGNTSNPRTVTVTANATYTASMAIDTYTLTVLSDDVNEGSVSGGGTYNYGTSVQISATAESGYEFTQWNDGNTSNPRTVTVTANATYTAYFQASVVQYTIGVYSADPNVGSVTGGGTYNAGATCTIEATVEDPNYEFDCWQDDDTFATYNDNPYTFTVSQDINFTANFQPYVPPTPEWTVTLNVNDPTMGTVDGAGTYMEGDTVSISAYHNSGYVFDGWYQNGVLVTTLNPYSFEIYNDEEYEAHFSVAVQTYTVTLYSDDVTMGDVVGDGTYNAGTDVEIEALPNAGYQFAYWLDTLTNVNYDNPATIYNISQNESWTAYFEEEPAPVQYWTVTLNVNDSNYGSVSGDGSYMDGQEVYINATPAQHCLFEYWYDDDNMEIYSYNPSESFYIDSDRSFTAHFAQNLNRVTVEANNSNYGTTNPSGTSQSLYWIGVDSITMEATPNTGYYFDHWEQSNGTFVSSSNPATVVTSDPATYIAVFVQNQIRYTASSAATGGWVTNNTDTTKNTWDSQTGEGVLYLNSGVTTLGGGRSTLDYSPFHQNMDVTEVDMSDSGLTTLLTSAFEVADNLINVVLPTTITQIGTSSDSHGVFEECGSLVSINLEDTQVTTIGKYCFYYNSSLTSITFPSTVTSIGTSAFELCPNLLSVTSNAIIPPSLGSSNFGASGDTLHTPSVAATKAYQAATNWGTAFTYYDPMPQIRYNSTSRLSSGRWIDNNTDKTKNTWDSTTHDGVLFLKSGVTTIGGGTSTDYSPFYNDRTVTSVDMSDSGLTTIGNRAFSGCKNLTSIDIPYTVTTIGDYVSYGANNLTSVTCYATTPPSLGVNDFPASSDTLYVPSTAVSTYQSNSSWNSVFTTITSI